MSASCNASRRERGSFAGVVLIVIGTVFLLVKTGVIERALLAQWWPLILIAIGGWMVLRAPKKIERGGSE
jgi:hypothetical protein